MNALFFLCGMVAVAFVLVISIYLVISGLPAILEIGPINFLFGTRWYASTGDFGIFAIILTSFAGTAGAILIGVPIGLMTAIFLAKVANPKLAEVVHTAVELLAGIPSVVYGLVGMILLVPAIRVAFRPALRRHAAGRHHRAGRHDPALHHLRVRDRPAGGAPGV